MSKEVKPALFTPAEFLTVILETAEEAKAYGQQHRHNCDECPPCICISTLEKDEKAQSALVTLVDQCARLADPLGTMLNGGTPLPSMMAVVCNCLLIGVRLGKAHADNRVLQEMIQRESHE